MERRIRTHRERSTLAPYIHDLEIAMLAATTKAFGRLKPPSFETQYSPKTGAVHLFVVFEVTSEEPDHRFQLRLETIRRYDLEPDVGDELLFELLTIPRGVGSAERVRYPWLAPFHERLPQLEQACAEMMQRALDR